MNDQLLIVGFIAVIITVIFLRYYFSKEAKVRRKLRKTGGKRISEFMSGDVAKVIGKVEFVGQPLTAPLSGRPCAYYYVHVERRVSSGKSHHWDTIIEEEVSGNFVIRDGQHCAKLDCQNVKSFLVQDMEYSSGFLDDATEKLESYLNQHSEKSENWLGMNKTLRYKEGILERGELVAVAGKGEWMNASRVQLPDSYGRVLVIAASEDESIYLSDDPETVVIDNA